MTELRYTLLSDGSSDRMLLHILTWLLSSHLSNWAIQAEWANLGKLPQPPKTLPDKIKTSLELYPCDLLFVHRDAENESRNKRISEIHEAVKQTGESVHIPVICVVPIRMTEAWLLFDENAIRRAAENPNGRQSLQLPNLSIIEQLPDPKNELCQILRQASGFTGRRLKQFKAREREKIQRLAELIDDFSQLNVLSAFQALDADIRNVIQTEGWKIE